MVVLVTHVSQLFLVASIRQRGNARSLNRATLEGTRQLAAKRILGGEAYVDVPRTFDLYLNAVSTWRTAYRGLRRYSSTANGSRTTALARCKANREAAHGHRCQEPVSTRLWIRVVKSSDRREQCIERSFGVVSHKATMKWSLHSMGLTPQKPLHAIFSHHEEECTRLAPVEFSAIVRRHKKRQETLPF